MVGAEPASAVLSRIGCLAMLQESLCLTLFFSRGYAASLEHTHLRLCCCAGLLPTGRLTHAGGRRQQQLNSHGQPLTVEGAGQGAYLSMCLAVKDQHADIREWIMHHERLGAGKFYIFDNNSTTPMLPVIADLVSPEACL